MIRPTLFLLHALGSSAREWDDVIVALGDDLDCVALDLPGFGDRAADADVDVSAMADWLANEVRARDPAAWMPVGHSMGGKLATIIAARAQGGEVGLSGLAGMVLLAGSPPEPEPMDEARRGEMIAWFADGAISVEDARTFVEANIAGPLPAPAMAKAIADVRRTSPLAWRAWLERGSREDWRPFVGTLSIPALIVAGSQDGDLGEANQRAMNGAVYSDATFEVIADAAHFLPYENPVRVAELIAAHWARVCTKVLPPPFAEVLASARVSRRTRRTMLERLAPPHDRYLSDRQRSTLAALLARVLPVDDATFDLAAQVEAALAAGQGDGWRFAELPDDRRAWAMGLDTLAAMDFGSLDVEAQDAALRALADGGDAIASTGSGLSAPQMKLWFEDVCAQAVRSWVSYPATMARIGFDGFANGGDGWRKQGFARTAADDIEPWQLPSTTSFS